MKLVTEIGESPTHLDGGLFLGSKKRQAEMKKVKTSPKADEDYPEVALASILAKVTRDRFMARQGRLYPGYGFEGHVGYGTKAHYAALKRLGPSALHRLTFLRSLGTMRT